MYLKTLKRHQDRLNKLKRVLNDMNIPFEEGDWQTIDRDREREIMEKDITTTKN